MKTFQLLNTSIADPGVQTLSGGSVSYFISAMPDSDSMNGDSLAIVDFDDKRSILILADGAGGTPGGNLASGVVIRTLLNFFDSEWQGMISLRELIFSGIELSNKELLALKNGSATTLIIVEIENHFFRAYQVGDSSAFVVGKRGKMKYKTLSQSPHGYAVEAGLMNTNEKPDSQLLSEVSNLVGDKHMHIDVGPKINLGIHDTVVVCSDGITDNITAESLAFLSRSGTLEIAGKALSKKITHNLEIENDPVKPDDHSFIMFRLSS